MATEPVSESAGTEASEALVRMGHITRMLWVLGVVLGVYVAVTVTVASAVGIVNSVRAVEEARQGREYARLALLQARENGVKAKENAELAELIRSCVTPGPNPPNAERTGTGNACYDDLEGNRAAAVRRIVDADGNGVLDATQILQALERVEKSR